VAKIAELIGMSTLRFDAEDVVMSTIPSIIANLPFIQFLHLACHGLQDVTDALKSGFCLHDNTLTISDIMNLNLGSSAFMAFLSACETAKGDPNQPNEVIHLAAALLFAGFRSIVATMW
jgi:CHAT domain-containing protein